MNLAIKIGAVVFALSLSILMLGGVQFSVNLLEARRAG